MSYWLIGVPNANSTEKAVFDQLNNQTKSQSKNYLFKIPSLKVGTLDTLMALSDDLVKFDQQVGQIAKKIEKTYFDLTKTEDESNKQSNAQSKDGKSDASANQSEAESLKIGQSTARDFVEKFSWNETRYPKRSPLRTLTELIVKEANKSDEAIKKQLTEYNEIRQNFTAIDRRDTGSLLVKSLSQYVSEKDMIEKGHLTTMIVVVPRAKIEEFETCYETMEEAQKVKEEAERARRAEDAENRRVEMVRRAAEKKAKTETKSNEEDEHEETENKEQVVDANADHHDQESSKTPKLPPCQIVVPRSAKKLFDDGKDEFVLYRIVVLKEGADLIRNVCRERRFTVRAYKHDPTEEKAEADKKIELAKKKKALWSYLLRWCSTTYAEVFAAWIHLKAIRLFVESVLRYGLPVSFTAILMEPQAKYEAKVRSTLKQLYGKLAGGANLTAGENEPDIAGLTAGEFYPYVYLPLSLTD